MGVAACRVGAVAADKEGARRGTGICRVVRQVAVLTLVAAASEEVSLTHSNLVGIVGEGALDATWAVA